MNWGENPTSKGPVIVDAKTVAAIQAQIDGETHRRILIDFDHQSVPQSPKYVPSPRKHVGYGDVVCLQGDGVYLDNIAYTPAGKEFAREYSDISPTVLLSADRAVVGVDSVALCPNGAVHDLTFLSADSSDHKATLGANSEKMRQLFEQIAALNEAMKALASDLGAVKQENAILRQANDDLVAKLDSSVSAFAAADAKALKAVEALERTTLLDGAAAAGKLLPLSDETLATMALPELRELIGKTKAGKVPLSAKTPTMVQDRDRGGEQKSTIARNCGV